MSINLTEIQTPESQLFSKGTDEDLEAGKGRDIKFLKKEGNTEETPPDDLDEDLEGEGLNDTLTEGISAAIQLGSTILLPKAVNFYREKTGRAGRVNTTQAVKAANMDAKTEQRVKKLLQRTLDYYLSDTTHPLVALLIVLFFYFAVSFSKMNDIADNEALKTQLKEKEEEIKLLKAKIKEKPKPEIKEDAEEKEIEIEEKPLVFKRKGRPKGSTNKKVNE